MNSNHNDTGVRALFVTDSHFHVRRSPDEDRRLRQMVALLDLHAGIPHVVLLGDIVDFWFDYPHFVMKGYEPLLDALDRVRAAGSRLHFVGGNHDIWAARYFHERYGTAPDAGPVTLDLDGRRVFCIHGDGMLGRDLIYRTFRAIVRHPAGVMLGKSLHPEVLFAFSAWLSGTSRESRRDETEGIERKARLWLSRQQDPPWDHLIMGHVHHASTTAHAGRSLTTLGGWLDPLHYGLWRDGALHLETAAADTRTGGPDCSDPPEDRRSTVATD